MRPKFDHDEEYLIAYYRQYRKSSGGRGIVQDLATVAIGAVFFGLGYFKSDITWSIIGFGLVSFRALRGVLSGSRFNRIFASIIEKYEGALEGEGKKSNPEQGGASRGG